MEIAGRSVFKRAARTKQTKKLDGTVVRVKVPSSWTFRIRYIDNDGKARSIESSGFQLKNQAVAARETAEAELLQTSGNIRAGKVMTFDDLAAVCKGDLYGDSRSSSTGSIIDTLCGFFGSFLLSSIDYGTVKLYRDRRVRQALKTIKKKPSDRRIQGSTVDKELRIMRSMWYYALEEGWVLKNPFKVSKKLQPLIQKPRGTKTRILSPDEERRLLENCGPMKRVIPYTRTRRPKGQDTAVPCHETFERETGNEFLKAAVLFGLDSGMRVGEILQLKWSDVDVKGRIAVIPAEYTKTKRGRIVPISDRLATELDRLRSLSAGPEIFPFSTIKRSFNTAKRLAGVEGFTFHDLRRTFTTRQIGEGTNVALIAKATGHQDLKVLMEHYAKIGAAEMRQVADTINAANRRNDEQQNSDEKEFIN
jgi:integrase